MSPEMRVPAPSTRFADAAGFRPDIRKELTE